MFVLDTNAVIHFFKGKGNVASHLLAKQPAEIALTAVTVFELERGVRKSPLGVERKTRLARFLASVDVLPLDERAAQQAAEIACYLETRGQPIGPLDTLIAAIARSHGATLVTHNLGEFSRVPELDVVDWYV